MTLASVITTPGAADNAPTAFGKVNLAIAQTNADVLAITALQTTVGGLGVTSSIMYMDQRPGLVDKTGATDYGAIVITALAAAAAANQLVVWNIPILCSTQNNPAKAIFFPNNVTVMFTGPGCIVCDGIGVPTLAFINSLDVTFVNFTAKYVVGALGAFGDLAASVFQTAFATFNTTNVTNYMTTALANTFTGGATAINNGNQTGALLYVAGGKRLRFLGLTRFYVPDGVNASQFIPFCFCWGAQWNSGTAIGSGTVISTATATVPTDVLIEDLWIDGTLMGQVGTAVNLQINNFKSERYSDFQTTAGGSVGGVGNWFPPPHSSYMITQNSMPVQNINCPNHIDVGPYVGAVTRRSTGSGYINSIKFEPANGSTWNTTLCTRPDGWADIISNGLKNGSLRGEHIEMDTSTQLTGGNAAASFAIRFPSGSALTNAKLYANIVDVATAPQGFPVLVDTGTGHTNLVTEFNVTVPDVPVSPAYGPGFGMAGINNNTTARVTYNAYSNTATTFTGALLNQGAANSSFSYFDFVIVGQRTFNSTNIDSLKSRVIVQSSGTNAANCPGNRVRVYDTNNNYEYIADGATLAEYWSQHQYVASVPAATTFTSTITIPSTFSVLQATYSTQVNFGVANGLTAIQMGWSGTPTALLAANQGITTGTAQFTPLAAPISLGGSNRTVLLTAIGGTGFDGIAGQCNLAVKAGRTVVAG